MIELHQLSCPNDQIIGLYTTYHSPDYWFARIHQKNWAENSFWRKFSLFSSRHWNARKQNTDYRLHIKDLVWNLPVCCCSSEAERKRGRESWGLVAHALPRSRSHARRSGQRHYAAKLQTLEIKRGRRCGNVRHSRGSRAISRICSRSVTTARGRWLGSGSRIIRGPLYSRERIREHDKWKHTGSPHDGFPCKTP